MLTPCTPPQEIEKPVVFRSRANSILATDDIYAKIRAYKGCNGDCELKRLKPKAHLMIYAKHKNPKPEEVNAIQPITTNANETVRLDDWPSCSRRSELRRSTPTISRMKTGLIGVGRLTLKSNGSGLRACLRKSRARIVEPLDAAVQNIIFQCRVERPCIMPARMTAVISANSHNTVEDE